MQASETEPNGGIVAATVAAGAGCAAVGLLTVGAAASAEFADLLNLYAPTRPLTGTGGTGARGRPADRPPAECHGCGAPVGRRVGGARNPGRARSR